MPGARILVLKQEGLRQFVEAEPAFAAIRAANPGVPIDLLTTAAFGRLAKGSPHFDRVLAAGSFNDKAAQKEFVSQLKRIGYEQVYDLDGTKATLELRSAMTGFRGPRWIGPKRVMTKEGRQTASFSGPAMRKLLSDARLPVEHRLPDLRWAFTARKDAANMQPSWFGITGQFALLLPATDPSRRWPAKAYAVLAQALAAEGIKSVVIGPDEISAFAHDIAKQDLGDGRSLGAGQVIDLAGKADLSQLAMLARHAQFFVAGATDELHLCASVGCPGLLLLHPADVSEAESLFGREVIKLTAQDVSRIDAEMAISMLRNMGLLKGAPKKGLRAFA
ncbi:glycosyltransferase family 9 protein [Parvularcula sp. LCG005]|uniref:glycosyltransferase family 9 protein n=1 Tax=Parvularcula sp. LCG005 TaxID=3078805 RepID=UPI00294268E0|nr:glycosyltransferase family 9 protein [Parvularcula sp. LCG005]WOI53659.1 glycosyltransferase family 9 protein [Parvularcula sp. LCG005]